MELEWKEYLGYGAASIPHPKLSVTKLQKQLQLLTTHLQVEKAKCIDEKIKAEDWQHR